ncbi:hypothetical protein [Xenorhabdus stockiae]|nr:hypothetical protein [Xenorhabdus stockiae]
MLMPPIEGILIHVHQGSAGYCEFITEGGGRYLRAIYQEWGDITEIKIID